MTDELLVHAVVNQIEADIKEYDHETIGLSVAKLISDPDAKDILVSYLSSTNRMNWLKGEVQKRW